MKNAQKVKKKQKKKVSFRGLQTENERKEIL